MAVAVAAASSSCRTTTFQMETNDGCVAYNREHNARAIVLRTALFQQPIYSMCCVLCV